MNDHDRDSLIKIGSRPPAGRIRERSDAARNRSRILSVAARLFAEHGVGEVSLDAIAGAAGVGKGTLFRRFGSKAGLAAALLDAQDSALQERIMFGPPPLGPGAAASGRITAFFDAYLELLEDNLELIRLSETAAPGARYRVGSYQFWRRHLAVLLAEACPELDAEVTAHLLLAPVTADLHHALRAAEFTPQRIRASVTALIHRFVGATDSPGALGGSGTRT
ncbi:TetR/AcrR family transcriptional regulator [Streptantibioticus rubrisoli]|uniref:TetR/AcrR family transcriptional regulator n=1 Tax=Streptantibioticus rubrisoli TaxID=1387313 RepID=A0ABT1P7X6_9ACTN|nr:TetR/AcrR family transcriptional regulator [Streptantibioticus rubrisoli]MCQ4041474.1 TetR/AcrR family transcriptional regulator [Streptantibioticus rubrisoli]